VELMETRKRTAGRNKRIDKFVYCGVASFIGSGINGN
jgi:hypothetical protein